VTSKTLQPSDSSAKPYPESTSPEQTGKVAEAVATYAVHWEPKPKTPARTIAGITADDAVWAFVKANTILSHLKTAIQLVREAFPKLQKISLRFAPDPEIPFFDAIVIDIKPLRSKIQKLILNLFYHQRIETTQLINTTTDKHYSFHLLGCFYPLGNFLLKAARRAPVFSLPENPA
jgi:hypothetical protein